MLKLSNLFSNNTTKQTEPVKKQLIQFNHIKGSGSYIFDLPGTSPKEIKITNKERKIYINVTNNVIGFITTYDQIDAKEIKALYKHGRLTVSINPDVNKFQPYDVSVELEKD